jgi:propionate CoA-transferase
VFQLTTAGLEIIEIAPDLDLDREIIAPMDFRSAISGTLYITDQAIYNDV